MKQYCLLILILAAMTGCDRQASTVKENQNQDQKPALLSQSDAARAHVQQYIDRLNGGDDTIKGKLLGMEGVGFTSIESIVIKSAVPAYTSEGKKIDDWIRVILSVKGHYDIAKQSIEKNITRDVRLIGEKWNIFGTDL